MSKSIIQRAVDTQTEELKQQLAAVTAERDALRKALVVMINVFCTSTDTDALQKAVDMAAAIDAVNGGAK